MGRREERGRTLPRKPSRSRDQGRREPLDSPPPRRPAAPLHVASGVPGHQGGARSERSSRWKVEPWRWERRGRREEHDSGEEIMFSLFFTVKRCCRLDRGS